MAEKIKSIVNRHHDASGIILKTEVVHVIVKLVIKVLFTRVRTNFCTDKNLHGSTLRLHGAGGTGRIFERLSVEVWDLKRAGHKVAHLAAQTFIQLRRSRVNARWNRASFYPCKNLSGPL